ncbi:MAG: hypothetical protein ACFNTU_02755 [Catonella sp.]
MQPERTAVSYTAREKVLSDFGIDKLIVCTDSGLSSTANRRFNDTKKRKFTAIQSIKKLKDFLKEFCLSDEEWKKVGSRKISHRVRYDKDSRGRTV